MSQEKLSPFQKEMLDAETKELVEAGYLDGTLRLSQKGREILDTIMYRKFKKELVEEAKRENTENQRKNK